MWACYSVRLAQGPHLRRFHPEDLAPASDIEDNDRQRITQASSFGCDLHFRRSAHRSARGKCLRKRSPPD